MTRRIILILVGALLILALMFALWFWLFGKQEEAGQNLGGFGAADDRGAGDGTGTGDGGNTEVLIGGTTDTTGGSGGGSTGNIQTPLYVAPPPEAQNPEEAPTPDTDFDYDDSGVSWLDGSSSGGTGSGVSFNPTPINQINNISIEGTAYFNNSSGGSGSGGTGLGGSLLGVAGGCVANYLTQRVIATGSTFVSGIFAAVSSVAVNDRNTQAGQTADNVIQCIVRSLARIAIQQLTAQTVSWINSGFNGEPAFVQDFDRFFTDVADKAAGSVIQGGDLAFLCSPFQLQVRIAIARSYAKRSSGASQSCTLTGVVNNVENFMNGNFRDGGWPGLIAFTTMPSNNPFGAYAGAQVLLNNRVIAATAQAERELTPGGFLSVKKCTKTIEEQTYGLDTSSDCEIVTPGATIEDSLSATLNADIEDLKVAESIDQIISALVNSLITNVLQKGLANVSSQNLGGQITPQDAQAAAEAQDLLQDLQTAVQRAQQYAGVQQGSISDIQAAQANLTALQNCWLGNNSSSDAQAAGAQVQTLETRIATYNNQITRANAVLAQIQQIQTQALSASNLSSVRAVATAFAQAEASGTLITAAEIINAQQNRTTLQSEMAIINQQTATELTQCYAE